MPYGPADELFVHQLPTTFDQVHNDESSWSDRCYFNLHAPDDSVLVVCGYGNYPNGQRAHGYAKVALADGRHWDLDAYRACTTDRADLHAGPMRLTCTEPMERWLLEVGPNDSGIEWELEYRSKAPPWDLLPIRIEKAGRAIVDMHHMKQPATYQGWFSVDGERFEVDGWTGGRDRTFGVRAAEHVDFWLWFEAVFDDRAIEAWVWESADGTVNYVDGGFTFDDGTLSPRFVSFEHEVRFDGDRRRPAGADIVFVDTEGARHEVTATATTQHCNANYGISIPNRQSGEGMMWSRWDGEDPEQLAECEAGTISMDQLMRFECDGRVGHGIFELLVSGEAYQRYPVWVPPSFPGV